ncbi:FYN-binding protein 1-like [Daktulosphaira vitifoliae]|uniref:FYN-binding protein 1-like n=1 Tax=Daktulosphaira vitifoliae TaxID=58002 RepID=UPI0021AA2B28|nr:FYN-binding protein 1-like [Daktulosphaira vitifoliae]
MPQHDLQRHPELWAAFVQGWQTCLAGVPTPPPAPIPPAVRPPFHPHTRHPVPRQQHTHTFRVPVNVRASPPSRAPSGSVKSATGSTSSAQSSTGLTYKERKKQRMVEYRKEKRKELQRLAKELKAQSLPSSQQHRLEKKSGERIKPPTPMPRSKPPSEVSSIVTEDIQMDIEDPVEGEVVPSPDHLSEDIETFLNPIPPSAP